MINGNLKGKKVQIVVDDIEIVYVLSYAPENKGLVIQETQNGKAAIKIT